MNAQPSFSSRILLKVSSTTPTTMFRNTKHPMMIHMTKKIDPSATFG